MDISTLQKELDRVVEEYGCRPFNFFTVLQNSTQSQLDVVYQNEQYNFVRAEVWHSLDLSSYLLWAISDNGDLLWWNGEQTIAMDHRGSAFVSEPVHPRQFIRLAGMGKVGRIFPSLSQSEA